MGIAMTSDNSIPREPRIAYLQPGQTVPKDARDALHSFNVSTTALALLGSLRDAGYGDLHFFDVACEQGDVLTELNEALFYKGAPDADVAAWLQGVAPDVVCVTSMFTCDTPAVDRLCTLVGQAVPDALLLVGGRHASLMPHWHMENAAVDFLVQGEGEEILVHLLDALSGRSDKDPGAMEGVFTRQTIDARSPKAWPEARLGGTFAFDLVLFKPDGSFRYKELVIADSPKDHLYKRKAVALRSAPLLPTRGCPLACRFCGSHFTPEMRPVGADKLMADIELCYDKGVRIFYNISENFCLGQEDRRFVAKLADFRDKVGGDLLLTHPNSTFLPVYMKGKVPDVEFIEQLQRAGTSLVTISIETFNARFDDKSLFRRYTKEQVEALFRHLQSVGMNVHLYMMTGFPTETEDELLGDVRRIKEWLEGGLIDAASWSNLLYLPGTPYYKEAIALGRFTEAEFRQWIYQGFYFFAAPERLNFSAVPTPRLREVLGHLRVGDYSFV